MSNRKEMLKKSLGITEYPWSSDEEEDNEEIVDPHLMAGRPSDIHLDSATDMPATSVAPVTSPQAVPRRLQARMDRDSYWSMMNNPRGLSFVARVRKNVPLSLVSRPRVATHSEPPPGPLADVQRIFRKNLGRTLNTFPSRSTNIPMNGREIFSTPSMAAVTSDVTEFMQSRNRRPQCRSTEPRRMGPIFNDASSDEPQASSNGVSRSMSNAMSNCDHEEAGPTSAVEPVNIDHSEDEVDRPSTSRPPPAAGDEDSMEHDNVEAVGSNNVSVVSMEDEVVEIDAEPDAGMAAQAGADAAPDAAEDMPNEESATTSNAGTGEGQQQPHGQKRKRDDASSVSTIGDMNDPHTVKEFNQNLLRLLECPVCLEWMEPPMSQCRRGHLVCVRCRARLNACPVCRTAFSSVRNRAMEGVAEMLRYPCRHGCGREVRLRRRAPHEASCSARRYRCPAPPCRERPPMPHHELARHFQSKHLSLLKIGKKHKFSMLANEEQHNNWLVMAMHELFHLRVDVDIRAWGVMVYVAYIGPKCNASNYTYEVTVYGQYNSRKIVYTRAAHCDLESSSLNVSRQDCFQLTLDQAQNFLRVKDRHCEPDKFLNFTVEITKCEVDTPRQDSDS